MHMWPWGANGKAQTATLSKSPGVVRTPGVILAGSVPTAPCAGTPTATADVIGGVAFGTTTTGGSTGGGASSCRDASGTLGVEALPLNVLAETGTATTFGTCRGSGASTGASTDAGSGTSTGASIGASIGASTGASTGAGGRGGTHSSGIVMLNLVSLGSMAIITGIAGSGGSIGGGCGAAAKALAGVEVLKWTWNGCLPRDASPLKAIGLGLAGASSRSEWATCQKGTGRTSASISSVKYLANA
mmetsp:Transcript_99092/g.266163  ORF Transcript_99092/g.266163 Transcript_99092/m.266163 type:complete len:245 (-) Transcript_99092:1814-2548(-)